MSASSDTIQLNDIGTVLRLTIEDDCTAVDVSAASTKQILLRSPAEVTSTVTASFTTDGTNGQIEYAVISGDMDEVGTWYMQGKVITAGGTWITSTTTFVVVENVL